MKNYRKMRAWPIVLLVSVVILVGVLNYVTYSRKDAPQPESNDLMLVVAQARPLYEEARHEQVVQLLEGRVNDLLEARYTDALEYYAKSRVMLTEEGNRHFGKAIYVWKQILTIDPQNAAAASAIARLSQSVNQTEAALKFGRIACQLSQEDVQQQVRLAMQLAKEAEYAEAEQIAHNALTIEPANVDALRVIIQCQLASEAPTASILASLKPLATSEQLQYQHRLILAQELNDADKLTAAVTSATKIADTDASLVQLVTDSFDNLGRPLEAAIYLREHLASRNSTTLHQPTEFTETQWAALDRSLMYREMQLGNARQAIDWIESHIKGTENYDDEAVAVEFLLHFLLGDVEPLPRLQQRIAASDSQLARNWQHVCAPLSIEPVDWQIVLVKADDALAVFPRSAHLYFLKGLALQSLGESDLAITAYRSASALSSAWVAPHLQLSSLYLERNDYVRSFVESATAAKINPTLPAASDTLLASAIQLLSTGKEVPQNLVAPAKSLLPLLLANSTSQVDRTLLKALIARLSGDAQASDSLVAKFLGTTDSLDYESLRILRSIASRNETLETINAREAKLAGDSMSKILEQAQTIAEEEGESKGIAFIDAYEINDQRLPEFSARLLKCMLNSRIRSKLEKFTWYDLAKDFKTSPRVLDTIIRIPVIAEDINSRRMIIDWMKSSSPNGLNWQLHEIAANLDEDRSSKQASQALLKLHDILKRAPTSKTAYGLMAVAYERVNMPIKAITTLKRAIVAGGDRPAYSLRLAELLFEQGQVEEATEFAQAAFRENQNSPPMLARAIKVLIAAEAFETTYNLLNPYLHTSTTLDNLDQFALVQSLALASANTGHHNELKTLIGVRPATSDDWFDLYIKVAQLEATPFKTATTWLARANSWIGDSDSRRRKMAGAWNRLANQGQANEQSKMIQIATKTIRPLAAADTNPKPADRLFLASLLQRQQNTEEAARIYREVGENEAYSSRLRAFALNNLAIIQFETTGEVQPAQLSAATAVELQPRGAYVDTLAYIFEEQGALEQSEKILTENLPRLPNDVKIRLRLIQVWQSLGKLAEADQLLGKVGTILLNSPNPMQLERDRTRELQSRQRQLESLKVDANAMDNSNPQGLSGTELQQVSR